MTESDVLGYLRTCYLEAETLSADPRTWNVALILADVRMIIAGNRFPTFVTETEERWQNKQNYVIHAERHAIIEAAKMGVSTYNATMVCPWFACPICAQCIAASGIKQVWGHDCDHHYTSKWYEQVQIGDAILKEAGVKINRICTRLGLQTRFDGKMVEV